MYIKDHRRGLNDISSPEGATLKRSILNAQKMVFKFYEMDPGLQMGDV